MKGFTLSPHRMSIIVHQKTEVKYIYIYMNTCAQYESVYLLNQYICWISIRTSQTSFICSMEDMYGTDVHDLEGFGFGHGMVR